MKLPTTRGRSLHQNTIPDPDVRDAATVFPAHGDRLALFQPLVPDVVVRGRGVEKALDLELGLLVSGVEDDEGDLVAVPAAALHDPAEFPAARNASVVATVELTCTEPVLLKVAETLVVPVPPVFSNVPALLKVPPPVVMGMVG